MNCTIFINFFRKNTAVQSKQKRILLIHQAIRSVVFRIGMTPPLSRLQQKNGKTLHDTM